MFIRILEIWLVALQLGLKAAVIGDGLWRTSISLDDTRRLGRPLSAVGSRTVLGITNPQPRDGSIYFEAGDAIVFNAGSSDDAIIVGLHSGASTSAIRASTQSAEGDTAFLQECTRLLPPDVAALAKRLVEGIRVEFVGRLSEGKARKWVNYPTNFVAITIQNRDESLAVHVKGIPERHAKTPLDLHDDRPGYSRFKISRLADLAPALQVIRHSASLANAQRLPSPK